MSIQRLGEEKPFRETVLCYKETGDIEGVSVVCFESEPELLMAFTRVMKAWDADIITGYNIENFDFPYLLDRASVLGLDHFCEFSRVFGSPATYKRSSFESKQAGKRATTKVVVPGRIVFDVYQVIRKAYNGLSAYSLNAVSRKFLKDEKMDLHYSTITDLWKKSVETRTRVAAYCVKDTRLPLLLIKKLNLVLRFIEQARVCRVPLDFVVRRGEQIKVMAQLLYIARKDGLVLGIKGTNIQGDQPVRTKYEGGAVLEPLRGYKDKPISVLDFSSLYPSEMIAHNLCYTTYIEPRFLHMVPRDHYEKSPEGNHHFLKKEIKKGLLPRMLEDLLSARKRAKADMARLKAAGDEFGSSVQDSRQLALKVSANSVYGYTGATGDAGMLPCLPVSETTTAWGRGAIHRSKTMVEEKGVGCRDGKCIVVYGDSVVGDTAVVVVQDGRVTTRRVDELTDEWSSFGNDGKQQATFDPPLYVWSDTGFTVVRRLIRHRHTGPLYRVTTHAGMVDCTADHSLLRADGTVLKPTDATVGTELLHHEVELSAWCVKDTGIDEDEAFVMGVYVGNSSLAALNLCYLNLFHNRYAEKRIPWEVLAAPQEVVSEFWRGFRTANGTPKGETVRFVQRGKEICTGLLLLGRRLGYNGSVNGYAGNTSCFEVVLSEWMPHAKNSIKSVLQLPDGHVPYVYDFETESHHFHVGPGSLVVHNTDSIMVDCEADTVAEAIEWGYKYAKIITEEEFGNEQPMNLAFEKVLYPSLYLEKKKYCGGYWTTKEKPDFVMYKGIEVARRDGCGLTRRMMSESLDYLFNKRDVEGGLEAAKRVVQQLLLGKVELNELVITKGLARSFESYANPDALPQVVLAKRLEARDPGNGPKVGDRIPYVMINRGGSSGGGGVADMAEDPLYVLDNDCAINVDYYLEKGIKKPLLRIWEPVVGAERAASIFSGDHTRKRVRHVSSKPRAGTLMSMGFVAMKQCLSCKASIATTDTLCRKCVAGGKEPEIRAEQSAMMSEAQAKYDEAYEHCMQCQSGDSTMVDLCMAKDCPHLYIRKGRESNLAKMKKLLDW